MTTGGRRARGAALVGACLLGCTSGPSTQLLVAVYSDLPSGTALRRVDVEVLSADGSMHRDGVSYALGDGQRSLPLSLAVIPTDGDAARRVRVVARGYLADARVVESVAITGFREGRELFLPLVLEAACVGHRGCADGTTCREGTCVSAQRPADALREMPRGELPPRETDGGAPSDGTSPPTDAPPPDVPPPAPRGPDLPAGATDCRADYASGECVLSAVSAVTQMPASCAPVGEGHRVRAYMGHYVGSVITLPRPARRLRMLWGGTGGAGCYLYLEDADQVTWFNPAPHSWCEELSGTTPALAIDFTAPPTSSGILRIRMNHLSNAVCYVGDIDPIYE